jgi:integrase
VAQKTKLTIRTIEAIEPTTKDVVVWDAEVTGFAIKVTPRGKRSYFLFYRAADHTQRKPKIGDYPAVKPEKARDIARDMLTEVRKGNDPSLARQSKRASRGEGTLRELFDAYKTHKRKDGRRSIGEIERIFEHDILPELGKRKPEEISTQDVSKLVNKIAARSPSVAWAVRRQLSAFYSWAIPQLSAGASNPVTHASRPPKVKARERVLTDDELKMLWTVLENEREPWRTGLRLLILTGQRREEVLSADWSEFNLPKKIWTIPADRAKNGRAHVVPLSAPVLELLKALPSRTGRLFPDGTGTAGNAAKRIREAMEEVPEFRWHDLRRTVATGLQQLKVRWEVTEAVLNHVSGSQAGIAGIYQRHDWAEEKRDALNRWGAQVRSIVSSKRSAAARRRRSLDKSPPSVETAKI